MVSYFLRHPSKTNLSMLLEQASLCSPCFLVLSSHNHPFRPAWKLWVPLCEHTFRVLSSSHGKMNLIEILLPAPFKMYIFLATFAQCFCGGRSPGVFIPRSLQKKPEKSGNSAKVPVIAVRKKREFVAAVSALKILCAPQLSTVGMVLKKKPAVWSNSSPIVNELRDFCMD